MMASKSIDGRGALALDTTLESGVGTYRQRPRVRMRVSIIIAVYNEARTVARLLERVWAQPIPEATKELVIVESNSTDGTRQIIKQFLQRHGRESCSRIEVIWQSAPKGKGNAVRAGLAAASGDVCLIQDGDLEYEVTDYPALLAPILQGRTDFVLGSRHIGPKRWRIRNFADHRWQAAIMNIGGMMFHAFFNVLFGSRLSDPTSMYKVFRTDCLEGLRLRCDRFDFDYELLGKLLRAGYRPLEVPVSYQSRGFDQGKKIQVFRDPFTWIIAIVRARFEPLYDARRRALSPVRSSEAPEPVARSMR
jgi:glycosyltransferase involved in cell wall biosynthesis